VDDDGGGVGEVEGVAEGAWVEEEAGMDEDECAFGGLCGGAINWDGGSAVGVFEGEGGFGGGVDESGGGDGSILVFVGVLGELPERAQ
jgi:hypothetical protein